MKLKKIFIISVISVLAVFLLSGTAMAELTLSDDLKTVKGFGTLTDDFEDAGVTSETKIPDYPGANSAAYTSNIIRYRGDTYNNSDMYLSPGMGTDGSTALKIGIIAGGSRNLCVLTKNVDYKDENGSVIENMSTVFSYDMLISEDPADTYVNSSCYRIGFGTGLYGFNTSACWMINLMMDDEGKFYFEDYSGTDERKLYYEKDKWYTVELVHSATSISASIMDKETGEVLLTSQKAKSASTIYEHFNAFFLNPAYDSKQKTDLNKGFVAYLDNATLNAYDENAAAELVSSTVENLTADASRSEGIMLTFTKAIDAESVVLLDKDGNALSDEYYEVKSIGTFKRKIVFKKLLEKNEEYTIDLSSAGIDSISFTTKAQYVLDCSYEGKTVSDDKKSVAVTYTLNDKGIESISYNLMGILYKDEMMIDAVIIPGEDVAMNTQRTDTFTFSEECDENTTLSIVFFEDGAWIPLSTGIDCN